MEVQPVEDQGNFQLMQPYPRHDGSE